MMSQTQNVEREMKRFKESRKIAILNKYKIKGRKRQCEKNND